MSNIEMTAHSNHLQETSNQLSLTYQKAVCRDVLEICRPIFDFFKITFFSHTRAFHDGRFTCLLSSTELTEYYLKKKFPISFSSGNGFNLETGYYIANHLNHVSSGQIREHLRDRFYTDHFLHIIEKQKNYDDMYSFATTPENDRIINQYLNERELLKHFILYYKNKSAQLIKNAETVKYSADYFNHDAETLLTHEKKFNRDLCINNMPLKKIHVLGNAGEVVMSRREFECLKYIVKNYTLKEIGKRLGLSPRTVETYLNNLKAKLACDRREQLITIAERFFC